MRLALNIDHFATLREARKGTEPEPVLVALLAEQAGAHGIVCHIRGDRRHIKERDLRLLRDTVKTKLNIEMAATDEMKKIALDIGPDVVSLVPERPEELTTEGGLNVAGERETPRPAYQGSQEGRHPCQHLHRPGPPGDRGGRGARVDLVEINTGKYADLKAGPGGDQALAAVQKAAEFGASKGLEIHGGHGLDYRNVLPIVAIPQMTELSHRVLHRRQGGGRRDQAGRQGNARSAGKMSLHGHPHPYRPAQERP